MAANVTMPHSVMIELTHRCNLSCRHCLANASSRGSSNRELSTEEVFQLIERLRVLQIYAISFSGGEIFVRRDLFEILRFIRNAGAQRVTLFTNGTLISESAAMQLKTLGIRHVVTSVDGMEASHDFIRGKGAFASTMNGIRALVEQGIRPRVTYTVMHCNYDQLLEVCGVLYGYGVRVLSANRVLPEGRCYDNYASLAVQDRSEICAVTEAIKAARMQYRDMRIDSNVGYYYHLPEVLAGESESGGEVERKVKRLKEGCSACSRSCQVTPLGDVIPCTGLQEFSGGNIREKDFVDIWTSEQFSAVRDLSNVSLMEVDHCKECSFNVVCSAGCRALAHIAFSDIRAADPLCPFWNSPFKVSEKNTTYTAARRPAASWS